jgi:uncharacterized protein (DUF2384 family)
MNIEDFLKTEKFKELDLFLNSEMKKYAGDELIKKMKSVFGDFEKSRNWFYSNLKSLRNERPYDYCRKGNVSDINDLLGRIEHGIFN